MEELDFFEEICLTSLYATKQSSRGYSFYHTYLIPTLNNKATICWLDLTSNKTHFEITEIANQEEDNNSKMLLAVTPLTQTKDKFLCIYLRMPSETPSQHQQIISRLCEAIQ